MNLTEFRKRYRYDPSYDKIGEGGFAKVYKARDMYYNCYIYYNIANAQSHIH
jgi:hypothetical protein